MFDDLGALDGSGNARNSLHNVEGHTQTLQNTISASTDSSNGLNFGDGDTQTINSVKFGVNRGSSVQFWFKGSYINSKQIVSLRQSSSVQSAIIARDGNNLKIMTTHSGSEIVLTNAVASLDSTSWTLVGLSIGWRARNNDYTLCGYVYQQNTNFEDGGCTSGLSISTSDITSGKVVEYRLGPGLSGWMKDVFTTDFLEDNYSFQRFKNSFGTVRKKCHMHSYHLEPYYINPGCGNGYMFASESSEACDDMNTDSGDGCSSTCTVEALYKHTRDGPANIGQNTFTCRNNIYEPQYQEECDDGNNSDLDGCLQDCKVEQGWTCTTVSGSPSVCTGICGDSYRVSDEACDDGDKTDGIGCLADCSGEVDGWHCSGGGLSANDNCSEQCNDGFITQSEQCEDGNTNALDGCDNCALEPGWSCSNNSAMTSTSCSPICGDQYRVQGESCDDGNKGDGIGCLADCSGEVDGWHCTDGDHTQPDTCTEQCHDGHITQSEQCEDGNTNDLDGCDNCVLEPGWSCANNTAMTTTSCSPICGDQYRVQGEACDDGDKTDGIGCLADCSGEVDGWHCSGGDHTQPDICLEQCNDGYITQSEQCEDGDLDNLDGCDNNCQIEFGWQCANNAAMTSSTCTPICGDGYIVDYETCDDGLDDHEGCNNACTGVTNGWYCNSTGSVPSHVCETKLMDGVRVAPYEECDDGNSVDSGDGCTNSGTIESRWICFDDSFQNNKSICEPLCGDGFHDHPDEQCDDDNYDDGDGCSSNCSIDEGWQCFNGSANTRDYCGKQPIATVDDHIRPNNITILFTEDMAEVDLNSTMNVTITGPMAPYVHVIEYEFIKGTPMNTIQLNISITSLMAGGKQELYTIDFDTTKMKSKFGAELLTKQLEGELYSKNDSFKCIIKDEKILFLILSSIKISKK